MSFKLRQSLFWDSDVRTIDLQKHKTAVIERIIMRGHLDEFRAMMEFYGKDAVKEVVLNARWLDRVKLAFCCTIFDVPKTAFRCYRLAESNPEHWSY